MRYDIGVDGGGTKTTAAVYAEGQSVLASATRGPANYRSVGMHEASANIAAAIRAALDAAGHSLDDMAAISLCLAGFDTELDLDVPHQAMSELGYEGAVIIENDVVGAWAGATGANAGVVVIAGTGSSALGMNTRGDFWRTDGWDYVLGDSGSGYEIGRAGIRTAMRALDGRIEHTLLARELGRAFRVKDGDGMRRLVDTTTFGKLEVASFAVHVSRAADEGDAFARDILTSAAEGLAEQAITIITRLGMRQDSFPVATVGSIFKSKEWIVAPFRQLVANAAPGAIFQAPMHPPEVGAAIMGLRRLDDGDFGSWTLNRGKRHITRSLAIRDVGKA